MSDPGADSLRAGLAAGRDEAFAELYDRYGERLYLAALRMLGRPEDAEDAVQDLFAAMARSHARFREVRDLPAYLFASLHRAAARCASRQSRGPRLARSPGDPPEPAEPASFEDPRADRLERALAALPAEQREAIAMKIHGDLTFAQIGQAMGVSPNTAASRYRHAIEKLRAALED